MAQEKYYINLDDGAEEVIRALGAAVVVQWWRIPDATRKHILDALGKVVGAGIPPSDVEDKLNLILNLNRGGPDKSGED